MMGNRRLAFLLSGDNWLLVVAISIVVAKVLNNCSSSAAAASLIGEDDDDDNNIPMPRRDRGALVAENDDAP